MYPSYRYHATEVPLIVKSPEEDEAASADGYEDTPAAFLKPKAAPAPPVAAAAATGKKNGR